MTYQCPRLRAVERIGKNLELLKLSALWIKPRRKNVYPTTSKGSMAQRHSHPSWACHGPAIYSRKGDPPAPHHLAAFEGWPSFKAQVESKHQKEACRWYPQQQGGLHLESGHSLQAFLCPCLYWFSMQPEASIVTKYKRIVSKCKCIVYKVQKCTFKVQKHTFKVQNLYFDVTSHRWKKKNWMPHFGFGMLWANSKCCSPLQTLPLQPHATTPPNIPRSPSLLFNLEVDLHLANPLQGKTDGLNRDGYLWIFRTEGGAYLIST